MATTNRVYIFIAFIFSAIAAIFNIVSLGTEKWINGRATLVNGTGDVNYVNYGLFQGNYKRSFPFKANYQITISELSRLWWSKTILQMLQAFSFCTFSRNEHNFLSNSTNSSLLCTEIIPTNVELKYFKNNICALLCGLDAEDRTDLLDNLYNNIIDPNYSMNNCPSVNTYTYKYRSFWNGQVRANSGIIISSNHFINAGIWISTVIFLVLAIVIGSSAATLAFYNIVTNPVQYFLSARSLFIYNAVAFGCTVLSMVLWGSEYNMRIFHNIGIYDTIVESLTSDKTAYLEYSYWISFIPLLFYTASIGILYYREYLNERDPKQKKVNLDTDSADPNLYLY